MKTVAFIGVLLSILGFSVAHAGTIPVVPVAPNVKTFKVILPANATTGFQWKMTYYDKKLLKLISQHYHPHRTQIHLLGSGGEMVYSFAYVGAKSRPQETTLLFTYHRPWEKQVVKPTQVVVVFTK